MAHPSPSMGARQTPGGGGGPAGPQGGGMMGMQGMGGSSGMSAMPMDERVLNHEIMNMPLISLNSIRQELGYGAKELGALDIQEKVDIRISSHFVLQSWLYLSLGFPPFFLLSSDLVDVACYIGKEEDWEQEASDQKAGERSKRTVDILCVIFSLSLNTCLDIHRLPNPTESDSGPLETERWAWPADKTWAPWSVRHDAWSTSAWKYAATTWRSAWRNEPPCTSTAKLTRRSQKEYHGRYGYGKRCHRPGHVRPALHEYGGPRHVQTRR